MLTHCKVNIKADGEVLKYRYMPITSAIGVRSGWTCNGEVVEGMTTDIVNSIFDRYENVEVTRKQQF
jgi:hypothetical protein